MQLAQCFGVTKKEHIAIIGSGGKTTLLWYLAQAFAQHKVLVTPSTKLFLPTQQLPAEQPLAQQVPAQQCYDGFISSHLFSTLTGAPIGVTLAGELPSSESLAHQVQKALTLPADERDAFFCKITPLTKQAIYKAKSIFDIILMESDGARNRPLKAWESYEPVIDPDTTHTIGVVPLSLVGKVVSEKNVHRFSLFCERASYVPNTPLLLQHIANNITNPEGMFTKAKGRKTLFISQTETVDHMRSSTLSSTKGTYAQAQKFVSLLQHTFFHHIDAIVAGSAQKGTGAILWQKKG